MNIATTTVIAGTTSAGGNYVLAPQTSPWLGVLVLVIVAVTGYLVIDTIVAYKNRPRIIQYGKVYGGNHKKNKKEGKKAKEQKAENK